MSFEEALKRATRSLGPIGVGATELPRSTDVALVELVFEEIQDAGRQPQPHLELPAHLGGETEARGLVSSSASKDTMMRADVFEWAELNAQVAADNARSLQTLAEAFLKAKTLLDESTGDEIEERKLHTWQATILAYAKHNFDADLRECDDPRTWCTRVMWERNPVWSWVYESASAHGRGFIKPKPTQETSSAKNMFRGVIGNKPDRRLPQEDDDDAKG